MIFLIPRFVFLNVPLELIVRVRPLVSADVLCMYKYLLMCVCVCVCARARACVCVYVCANRYTCKYMSIFTYLKATAVAKINTLKFP